MNYRFLIVAVVLSLCNIMVYGQGKALSKATKLYKEKQYTEAIPFFKEAVAENASLALKMKLANCYKQTNQYDDAEKVYSEIVFDDKAKPIAFKYYAQSLMGNGKYAAAKFWVEEFLKKKPDDAQAQQLLKACNTIYSIKPIFPEMQLTSFDFNSEFNDNGAVMRGTEIFFASDRPAGNRLIKQKVTDDGRDFVSVFSSKKQLDKYVMPKRFTNKINLLNKNTGPITFSGDGTFAVFSRNDIDPNKKNEYSLQLYQAEFIDGKWKNIKLLNFCNSSVNYMHPALSPDGKFLIFSSNRGGGVGKADLYIAERKAAAWAMPKNLGDVINTSESEGFPFWAADGTLYFCSKGHVGFGGFDLFSSKKDNSGNWTEPTNLGIPANSSADDLSFYINEKGDEGIVCSARDSGDDDLLLFTIGKKEEVVEDVPDFAKEAIEREKKETELRKQETEAALAAKEADELRRKQSRAKAEADAQAAIDELNNRKVEPVVSEELVTEKEEVVASFDIDEPTGLNTINNKSNEAIKDEIKSDTFLIDKMPEPSNEAFAANRIKAKVNKKPVDTNLNVELATISNSIEDEKTIATAPIGAVEEKVETEVETEVEKEESLTEVVPIEKDEEVVMDKIKSTVKPDTQLTEQVKTEQLVNAKRDMDVESSEKVVVNTQLPEPKVEIEKAVVDEKVDDTPLATSPIEVEKKVAAVVSTDPPVLEDVKNSSIKTSAIANTKAVVANLIHDISSVTGASEKKYSLENLTYEFNATDVTSILEAPLNDLAVVLIENPNLKLKLIGHTASIGGDEKNMRLSFTRAATAVDYLIKKGANPKQLSYDGKGETELINNCNDGVLCSKDQHQENERIEIVILSK